MNDTKIIACVDRSKYANAVADWSAWVANQIQAPIEFLHAIDRHLDQGSSQDHSGTLRANEQEELLNKLSEDEHKKTRHAREQGRQFLHALKESSSKLTTQHIDTRLRHGSLLSTLAEREPESRLVVMGCCGESAPQTDQKIGQTLESIVRGVKKPVLVVPNEFKPPRRFLFAFDGSIISKRGIQIMMESRLFQGMEGVLLLCGKKNTSAMKMLEDSAQGLTHAGIPTQCHQAGGDVVREVVQGLKQHQADLLVMGAYTHSPIRHFFFGSKTNEILQASEVPALLLRK